MAQTSRSQEYWRPPNPQAARLLDLDLDGAACGHCGTEYLPGARFCHMCGSGREAARRSATLTTEVQRSAGTPETRSGGSRLPLRLPSLVCLVLGVGCVIGAALMGVIYKTETLVDWQAVQVWRIEWLLAALVALLAGVLFKKTEP